MNKNNNIYLIFGASSGIGYHTAKILKKQNNIIYNCSRKECDIDGVNNICHDITKTNCEEILKQIINKEKKIDGIIYSIGWSFTAPTVFSKEVDYKYLFDTNFFCMVKIVKAAIKYLDKCNIIIVSSIGGVIEIPYESFYSASKAAVIQWIKAIRHELKKIQISAILPGGTKTSFTFSRKYYEVSDYMFKTKYKNSEKTIIKIEQKGMKPEIVAKSIIKKIKKKKLPATFTVGLKNKLIILFQKILPYYFNSFCVKCLFFSDK